MKKINVIGLGNVLFGDEGFGVEAVRRLEKQCGDIPDSVRFIDGGTQGLNLLDYIESADTVMVFDAIIPTEYERKVYIYENDDLPAFIHRKMSSHQMGLSELLSVAKLHGKVPEKLILIGVPPHTLELGCGISREVEALLEEAVKEGKQIIDSVLSG